ncbi:hypothetical protein BDU57DRAFT_547292 [Ampelomyces quisqualis]|uniref:Uncharacterized protein n=1 Tax=Ampelomyces quisqualis TaxID=50730 RepID=A0A6A5QRB1_AMPQU|nr:hypothetical protein BDU57DRAFT_547292 [Ampelomyces quisqualis]
MSGPDRPEPTVATTRGLKRKSFSKDEQEDLDELDAVFKRIKAATPRVPYILSTPSLNPYRYHSQQEANAWMLGHLWRPDEEPLQYRTYVYREPCQDCLELQAGDDDPEPERPDSRSSNAGGQVAKKKLNLSAFKVKQANGTVTPGSKRASPALPPTKVNLEQVNAGNKPEKQEHKAGQPIRSSNDARDERKATKAGHDGADPAAQRPRNADAAGSKIQLDKSTHSDRTPHGLPPLLSPVHEPPGNPYGLPDILSPTLPTNIQTELDRIDMQRKRAESNASTSSSDRKSQSLAVPGATSQKPVTATKTEPRIRSVSINGKSPNVEVPKNKEAVSPSLIVKLKFSKAKIPTVSQLLRLPSKRSAAEKKGRVETRDAPSNSQTKTQEEEPRKKKPVPKVAARRSDNTTPVSAPATKPAVTVTPAPTIAKKRPRTDDDVPSAVPSKRPRAASSQDRSHTPLQQVVSSPSVSNKSSAQKSQPQYATPKNSHKTVSMLRTNSTESNDSTPGRSVSTPAGAKTEARGGPTSAPLTDMKPAGFNLLNQTSMKLNQMGRALKHEATKILQNAGKSNTKQDEKRAAVTNMECILSYMAAYHAQDASLGLRGRLGDVEGTWKTLLPLCLSYARSTKDFKHLDGLRSYLSSVIASNICTQVSQRAATSRPHDSPHDVPHADLAKQHAALLSNFSLLSDHTMKMHSHYQDARIALPSEDIQSMYKKTFLGREANAKAAKEPEKVNGARMSGPYFLPLSSDTTPIQAVRFGLKFLAEFCEKEKLDYQLRVNLDKAD